LRCILPYGVDAHGYSVHRSHVDLAAIRYNLGDTNNIDASETCRPGFSTTSTARAFRVVPLPQDRKDGMIDRVLPFTTHPRHRASRGAWRIVGALVLLLMMDSAPTEPVLAQNGAWSTLVSFSGNQPSTSDIEVGDVDGDGTLDIVVVNIDQPSFVYFNTDGTFGSATPFADPTGQTGSAALGDLDDDGDLDIVVARRGAQSMVFINDGAGRFSSTRTFGATNAPATDVAIADMDGDGWLDIVASADGRQGWVYLNDGAARWGAEIRRWGARTGTTSEIVVADWDGDGDADIVTGSGEGPHTLLRNDGAANLGAPELFGSGGTVTALAAEDLDADGDLDLAASYEAQPTVVFLNDGAGTLTSYATLGTDTMRIHALAAADIDRDNDIDLFAGSRGQQNMLFVNDGTGTFSRRTAVGDDGYSTVAAAAADMDGDSFLDIVTANFEQIGIIYLNDGGATPAPAQLFGPPDARIVGIATGDLDGDRDLDVVVADNGDGPNRLYLNDGAGTLDAGHPFGTDSRDSTSVALADLDGDTDLDIVVGNSVQPNKVYFNAGDGTFPATGEDVGPADRDTRSVATGDVDGDGDLDIVAAYAGFADSLVEGTVVEPVTLFPNDGNGTFGTSQTLGYNRATSVALGDMDGDGGLDIVVGNAVQQSKVYLNDGGAWNDMRLVGSSADTLPLRALALGDTDHDGDLDIIAGSYDRLVTTFVNDGAANWTRAPAWNSGPEKTRALALGDVDNDGDLDIVTGNEWHASRVWRFTERPTQPVAPQSRWLLGDGTTRTWALGLADLDGDNTADIIAGNVEQPSAVYLSNRRDRSARANHAPSVRIAHPGPTDAANVGGSPVVLASPTITVSYTLSDAESDSVRFIRAQYSNDGGGTWSPAVPTTSTRTEHLATSPEGITYDFGWDTFASQFFGQSDNVVLRIEAYGTLRGRSGATGAAHRAKVAAQTLPVRVRGTQVRVVENGEGVAGALVYHLPADQNRNAQPFRNSLGEPFRTNAQGYLEGSGRIGLHDKLFALLPVSDGATTLYHTNGTPTVPSMSGYRVTAPGIQTLTVEADKPLLLIPLTVSLEWDARADQPFVDRLKRDLQRTSELLFDWSNGQAALGDITLRHEREAWDSADVRVYATNSLRPNAAQGGIVAEPTDDPAAEGVGYAPGQVRIGAVWNRFGEASNNLGEDWPRTLAHELGHYVFFLDDDYLGLDRNGLLMPVYTCVETAMSDPYRDDWSEFRAGGIAWEQECGDTLAHKLTGRADWETIQTFYPALRAGTSNVGPNSLPLAVTTIREVAPATPNTTVGTPLYDLSYNDATYVPGPGARVFLYHGDRVTDLGAPNGDAILARGARPGDRLCVYEGGRGRLGCRILGSGFDMQLPMIDRPDWRPELLVTPVNSSTVSVRVNNVGPGLRMSARLFPADDPAPAAQPLTDEGDGYSTTFNLPTPALEGYVQIWVENDSSQRRESVADYALGGNPGFIRGRGGFIRGRGINGSSADGQVMLFGDGLNERAGRFFSLQAATHIPNVPSWVSVVGKVYWLHVATPAPDLARTSISFGYLGSDVPPGEEDGLRMYVFKDGTWTALPTNLDTTRNFASAPAQGPGLYALMSSIDIRLERTGWNLFAYPVHDTRTVTDTLRSIEPHYTTVYGYSGTDAMPNLWHVYDRDAPSYVNTLHTFEWGRGYWINVTQPVTLHLRGLATPSTIRSQVESEADSLPVPPATYYGAITADVPLRAGMQVTASVDGKACGFGRTIVVDGTYVYTVNVSADGDGTSGCGAAGRVVTFKVGKYPMLVARPWSGSGVWEQPLVGHRVALPLVGKR
jgi:hypothetical protein